MARIEAATGREEVCITFQIQRGEVSFQVPIRLSVSDYDDTEMVQAARNTLHRTFVELASPKPGLEAFGERPAAAVTHQFAPN